MMVFATMRKGEKKEQMDNLINRQAAIDALEKAKIYCTAIKGDYIQTDYFKQYNMGLTDGIKALDKLQSAQEWIPITTRLMTEDERKEWSEKLGYDIDGDDAKIYCNLPDDGQRVLVYYKYSGEVGIDTFREDDGCYFEDNGDMDGITHWMPRPEPPKQEENGTD